MLISRFRSQSSKLHQTCFLGVHHIYITFPVEENKQTNKQKRHKWPEIPFCPGHCNDIVALGFVTLTDHILALGLHLCKYKSIVADIPWQSFWLPYSISASLPEKLSLNGNFSYRLLIIVEKYQTYLRDLSHIILHVNFTSIMIT